MSGFVRSGRARILGIKSRVFKEGGWWLLSAVVLNLALVATIVYDVVGFARQFSGFGQIAGGGGGSPSRILAGLPNKGGDPIRDMAGWQPFGTDRSGPTSAGVNRPVVQVQAPETKLDLTLLGILYSGGSSQRAYALIAKPGGDERSYAVGELLVGDVKLDAIYPDRVILGRNGRAEMLRLPRDLLAEGMVSPNQGGENGPGQMAGALKNLRRDILTQPEKVAEKVRVEPYSSQGEFKGFQLFSGEDKNFLKPFGLVDGDVITQVNDLRLTGPLKGAEALAQLGSLRDFRLEILRNNQILKIFLSLGP